MSLIGSNSVIKNTSEKETYCKRPPPYISSNSVWPFQQCNAFPVPTVYDQDIEKETYCKLANGRLHISGQHHQLNSHQGGL
uniref:Uncharacterized protein n=1 Tax=Solanum lycopersicum TaxID=4081 RepID=A0A3Q7EZM8_SOLLC